MTKKIFPKIKKWVSSLRFRFIVIFVLATIIAAAVVVVGHFGVKLYIESVYLSEDKKQQREEALLEDLQEFIENNKITADNTEKIGDWARKNRYVYLLIYKGNELYFTSDNIPKPPSDKTPPDDSLPGGDATDTGDKEDSSQDGPGGITIEYPTREELLEYAKKNQMYLLDLADSGENSDTPPIFAQFTEYTEYFFRDASNVGLILLSAIVIISIMLLYIRSVTKRILSLGEEVNKVAAGDNEGAITATGKDEISELAVNVESMRSSIVENYKKQQEVMQANTELITSMSHDIRTPLTVLLGYIDLMREHAEGDEKMQEYLRSAESTAMRLKKLSDDMFGYFLVFGGKEMKPEIEKYDAETLISQLLSEHLLLMAESKYTLEVSGMDNAALAAKSVYTEAKSLVRIFDNIFSNLYKYADKSKPIKISVSADACNIILQFENVIRKDGELVESNGIGLKTCDKIAEALKHEFLHFESENSYIVKLSLQYEAN